MSGDINNQLAREEILEAIRKGRVKMRPRWHFVLRALLAALGAIILLLALLYLASFVIFVLHRTGAWFVPAFGLRGLYVFLLSMPWLLILLSLVFAAILEILVRHYAFAYRRPLLYSVLGILLVAVAGGLMVAGTPFHGRMSRYAEENRLPVAGRFYREFGRRPFREVHSGKVASVEREGFALRDIRGEILNIVITPRTRLPYGMDFSVGDSVVVFGVRDDGRVQAFGVREVKE